MGVNTSRWEDLSWFDFFQNPIFFRFRWKFSEWRSTCLNEQRRLFFHQISDLPFLFGLLSGLTQRALIFLLSHWWKCKDGSRHKDGGCSKLSFPSGDDRRSYTSNILFFSRHVTKGIHKHSYRGTVISHFEFSRRFHSSPSIKTMIGGNMYYGIIELHFYPLWQWLREREGWEMTSSSSFTETQEFVYNNVIWMSTQILGL